MTGKATATANKRKQKYRRGMMTYRERTSPRLHNLDAIMPQVEWHSRRVGKIIFVPKQEQLPRWELFHADRLTGS